MGEAEREGGRKLLKLNELFSGHSSHQSAMYELRFCDQTEYQSSSDIITKTGTGATSRASSIARATKLQSKLLPGPTESSICFLVREGWAGLFTGSDVVSGTIDESPTLTIRS